jgi:hypothetical protein
MSAIRFEAHSGQIEQIVHCRTLRSICLLTGALTPCPLSNVRFTLRIDGEEASPMRSQGSTTSMPRWVKAFGVVAILVGSLFVILHLAGYGLGGHTLHSGVVHRP